MRALRAFVCLVAAAIAVGCAGRQDDATSGGPESSEPARPGAASRAASEPERAGSPAPAAGAATAGRGLTDSTPEAEGLDPEAVDRLMEAARSSGSSAVVILRNGKLVVESYFGGRSRRIEAMSATKSIVNLAVGLLVDGGAIDSIDVPGHDLYPEWHQGLKAKITIRHLLDHTSGLQANRNTKAIYRSQDFVQLALAADLTDPPGAAFFYNNKAVNLLPGIVKRASGERMDEYLRERLFEPMGIEDVSWTLDPAGNPHGMSGLQIHAADLAKVGQMMLDGGTWRGERIVSESWIEASTGEPAQPASRSGPCARPAFASRSSPPCPSSSRR